MKVAKALKRKIRWSFGVLFTSGLAYWMTRLFLRKPGLFGGEAPHPIERALGPLHLAAALFFLFVLGIVWAQHATVSIRAGKQRPSGWGFYAAITLLALSGITMLYGNDALIHRAEQLHPWFGVCLLPVLVFHWTRARRQTYN